MPLTAAERTLLEKAANDNGFDLGPIPAGDWLAFSSSHVPLRIWLTVGTQGGLLAALSQKNVLKGLADHGSAVSEPEPPLPDGAGGARAVPDFKALHGLLRRAFQLSRTLPDELWKTFARRTAKMSRSTEIERLVVQRVGQDLFRDGLLDYWEGRCAVLGLAVPALLRASHIKPWADCDRDEERLDIFNGLLLSAHLDAAFDGGYVTVADDGAVVVSEALDGSARALLGLDQPLKVRGLAKGHRHYLAWHRSKRFKAPARA
jgi:hypothetical protein